RSDICASSTTYCCHRRLRTRTPKRCPTSSAAASPGARSSRRARRSSDIRARAGIAPRLPTIVRLPLPSTSSDWNRSPEPMDSMDFDIPREVILPVERVDVRLDPGPHPFETANLAAIDANWVQEQAANPALFDGDMALLSRLEYRNGRVEGACH